MTCAHRFRPFTPRGFLRAHLCSCQSTEIQGCSPMGPHGQGERPLAAREVRPRPRGLREGYLTVPVECGPRAQSRRAVRKHRPLAAC
eukprot:5074817-Pyramimonas_sp.AAC.2